MLRGFFCLLRYFVVNHVFYLAVGRINTEVGHDIVSTFVVQEVILSVLNLVNG